jgi:hypothetical protein
MVTIVTTIRDFCHSKALKLLLSLTNFRQLLLVSDFIPEKKNLFIERKPIENGEKTENVKVKEKKRKQK